MGLGIVRVTREFIYNAIKEKSTNLPKDAVLGGIGYDIDRACIYVLIEHPSIESVPQGEVLPTVTPILGWDE